VYLHKFSNGKIYIGKGKENRCYDFRQRSRYWRHVFSKYGDPIVYILADGLEEEEALELEVFCIAEHVDSGYLLRSTLINLTLGGEGISGYNHTEETKKIIGEASKACWKNPELAEYIKAKNREYHASERGKNCKSRTTKKLWEKPGYREKKMEQLKDLWEDPEHRAKMTARMQGSNNPSAKVANIYKYPSGELIAERVVSAEWARENGYSRPKLQTTAKADRTKPSTANNPHHHKGVYMEYIYD
jgi:hypothetical protein